MSDRIIYQKYNCTSACQVQPAASNRRHDEDSFRRVSDELLDGLGPVRVCHVAIDRQITKSVEFQYLTKMRKTSSANFQYAYITK